MPAVPQSEQAMAEEIRRRHALLTPEQRRHVTYVADGPNWDVWFMTKHVMRRHGAV